MAVQAVTITDLIQSAAVGARDGFLTLQSVTDIYLDTFEITVTYSCSTDISIGVNLNFGIFGGVNIDAKRNVTYGLTVKFVFTGRPPTA
ncbi:hypothetical protein ES703_117696 [subsurface metagenome]